MRQPKKLPPVIPVKKPETEESQEQKLRRQIVRITIAEGWSTARLARYLEITEQELKRIYAKEIARAKDEIDITVTKNIIQKAMAGEQPYDMMWANAKMGWKTQTKAEVTGPDGGPIEIKDAAERVRSKLLDLAKRHRESSGDPK